MYGYIGVCTWACPSIPRGSLLLARTREAEATAERRTSEPASERASKRTSGRTSQPAAVARHGCALLTYTPVLLFVSLLPTGPSFSHDRGLAI